MNCTFFNENVEIYLKFIDIVKLKNELRKIQGNITSNNTHQDEEETPETSTFNPEELTIGKAINANKYGWKVPEYMVTTEEFKTGVWRLFYQDSNYTYLIIDECIGNYFPDNYISSYTNGADVSIVGQKLNPMVSSRFISNNKNRHMKITAWLTDTSDTGMWEDYKNIDTIFAIGAPTIELFATSYNATGKSNKMTVDVGDMGEYIVTITNNGRLSVTH